MATEMTEALSRSRASLDPIVRDILTQGRTVRSRNRDGEYAIVLTDNRAVVDTKTSERIDGVADPVADWTIAITDFTFKNVTDSDPDLPFWAPVFDRAGVRVGTIRVNGTPYGTRRTTEGRVRTQALLFTSLREGDLFTEREADGQGSAVVFRATADADRSGRLTAVVVRSGEERVFDLGPDYLAFKLIA
jgi:hypothetical protein